MDNESYCKVEKLKTLMLSAPVVRLPNVVKQFVFETDGSKVAVDAVLKQRFDDTNFKHQSNFSAEHSMDKNETTRLTN